MEKNFVISIIQEDISFLHPAIIEVIIAVFDVSFKGIFPRHTLSLALGVTPVKGIISRLLAKLR
jgi:hypothetical protein